MLPANVFRSPVVRRTAALIAVLMAIAPRVRATVIVPADLAELSHDARAIARGRVAAVTGRWTEDRRTIETIVKLEVDRYLKGSFGGTIEFRVPGGELGRYRNVVVGAPEFAVGDRVIVFLAAAGPMIPYIVGFNQGVYRIVAGAERNAALVTPPPILPGPQPRRIVRGDPTRRPLPLEKFEQRVIALVRGVQ
jgi:hypothetical protein